MWILRYTAFSAPSAAARRTRRSAFSRLAALSAFALSWTAAARMGLLSAGPRGYRRADRARAARPRAHINRTPTGERGPLTGAPTLGPAMLRAAARTGAAR